MSIHRGKIGKTVLDSTPVVVPRNWADDTHDKGHKVCGAEPLRDELDFCWFLVDGRHTGERVNHRDHSSAEKRSARDEA